MASALFTPVSGAVLGLLIALVLFSTLMGDNALAKLAQHLLVGAALGYAALLAIRELLLPSLAAVLTNTPGRGWLWIPLALGTLLWLAGFDYMRQPANPANLPAWRQLLRTVGMLPVLLLLGVGLTVGLIGAWQGTLLPQIRAAVGGDVQVGAQSLALLGALLGLVLTTATLLYLTWPQGWHPSRVPGWLQSPVTVWRWIGLRGLWFAAGVLFARLAAARLSLLISWIEMLVRQFETTGLRALWSALWERL
jgi:hypothetical protein